MKRLSITLALILMACVASFAQEIKGSPTKAKAFMQKGDLVNAKLYIDAYLDSEKYKKKSKVGPLVDQAVIYMAIAMSDKPEDQKLLKDPVNDVLALFEGIREKTGGKGPEYDKVFVGMSEIDMETMNYKLSLQEQFKTYYFQKGANAYNNDNDYEKASMNFETAFTINPKDTTALTYAFAAARQAEMEEAVQRTGDKLVALKYPQPDPYLILSYNQYVKGNEIMEEAGSDEESIKKAKESAAPYFKKMLEYATVGIESVDDSLQAGLQQKQIEAYSLLGEMDKVIDMRKQEVKDNPNSKEAYFKLGYAYDETGKKEEAEKNYLKALEIDPDFYAANLNVAVIYLQDAKEIFRQLNDLLDINNRYTDQKKGDELDEEYIRISKKAKPFLEKAHAAKSDDLAVMQRLLQIYRTLELDAEYKMMSEKINKMD